MRIDELAIHRYGKLHDQRFAFERDCNLFFIYGDNEAGKTLSLDALSKFILPNKPDISKKADKYGFIHNQINRVNYFPDGYALLSDEVGHNYKLPDQLSLYELINMPLKSFKNVLLIRDSDLSINEERDFYQQVTEHLTGMRLQDIEKIKEQIRQKNRLTRQLNFSDRENDQKLLSRIKLGEEVSVKISELIAEAQSQGYDSLEAELVLYQQELEKTEVQIGEMETAYYQSLYYRAREQVQNLESAFDRLQSISNFSQEGFDNWKSIENKLSHYQKEQNDVEQKIQKLQEKLSSIQEEKSRLAKEVQSNENKYDELQKIKSKIEKLREAQTEMSSYEAKRTVLKNARNIASVLTVIFIVVSLIHQTVWLWGISSVLTIITLISILPDWKYAYHYSELRRGIEQVKNQLATIMPREDLTQDLSLETIISQVSQFEENYRSKYKRYYEEILPKEKTLQNQITDLNEQRKQLEESVENCRKQIQKLQSKWGVDNSQEYSQNLRVKLESERQQELAMNSLTNIFDLEYNENSKNYNTSGDNKSYSTLDERILEYWREKVSELQDYIYVDLAVEFSQQKLNELRNHKESLNEQIADITEQINKYREKLSEVETQASKVLYPENQEQVICRSTANLFEIQERLAEFINNQKWKQKVAINIDEILEDIVQEEQHKISELFSDNKVSEYFCELTGGEYENVIFNEQENTILCEHNNGSYLDAYQLSGFTWDQLYFSIRLALAELLMQTEKGFLLLDDPFVKADVHRLRTQLNMLQKISEWGWQIIYFTAKQEVKDLADELASSYGDGQVITKTI